MLIKNAAKKSVLILLYLILSAYSLIAGATSTVQQFNIDTGRIAAWTPDTAMKKYIDDSLYNLLDGGAPQYLNKGCLVTGFQRCNNPDGALAEIKVMDFGKDSNATGMFKQMQSNNIGSIVTDPLFPDSMVLVTPNMGGATGYAHFSNIYVELSVTGFADQQNAIQTLNLFLTFYQNKIKAIEKTSVNHIVSAIRSIKNANPYRGEVFLLEGRHTRLNSSSSNFTLRGQLLGKIQTMQLIIIKDQ
jgi:hypothetical protein